jgi:hypothetical protein
MNSQEPQKRRVVYTRRSVKEKNSKNKVPQELIEARLFVYLKKLGWQENEIVLF